MSKTVTLITVILSLSYVFCTAEDKDFELEIVPKTHDGYEVKDGKIFYRYGKAGLILEPANAAVIRQYFSERGSSVANPFLDTDEELEHGTFFLLSLINHSKGTLTFTPRYIALKIKTEASFAIDFTVLMSIMQRLDPYNRKLLDRSIYHSPETIQPGDSETKFLVFPPLPKKEAELKMEFDYMFFENKELKTFFYFIRQKIGESKKGTVYKNP